MVKRMMLKYILFPHQIDDGHRLLTKTGLRLRVFMNGKEDTDENETVVYFNIREATRGVDVVCQNCFLT